MSSRSIKANGALLVALALVAIGAAIKIAGDVWPVLALLAVAVGGWFAYTAVAKRRAQSERAAALLARYGDQAVVRAILKGSFWHGQTEEQLIEALGPPAAIDKQGPRTNRREVWKYEGRRRGRFALRIRLENKKVVGWAKKE